MKHIFSHDSQLMQVLSKLADLILLNLCLIVCSVPVITIGPAITALYDVTGRMVRKEEAAISCYWKSFKSNLKQAMILWLFLLIPGLVLVYAWLLVAAEKMSGEIPLLISLCIASFLYLGISAWGFPMQARFINQVGQTLRNAAYCGLMYLPKTILLVVINAIPFGCFLFKMETFIELTPVWIGLWFSSSAYLSMWLLKKPFQNLEKLVPGTGTEST